MFRSIVIAIILAFFAAATFGQTSGQVLAIANGQRISVEDLPLPVRTEYENLAASMAERRKELLEVQIIDTLAELESAARKIAFEQLYEREVKAKVPDPTDKEIQDIYNANRLALDNRPIAEVRDQIVTFLRSEPEQKAFNAFVAALKTKYKTVTGKSVNAANLAPADVLATVNGKPITVAMFEAKNKVTLFELKAKVFDRVKFELNKLIFSALVSAEAKSLAIEPHKLIAQEITDKLRDYSDEEREELESALRRRLAAKYKPQFLYSEPAPIVFQIATDGKPSKGAATAPVTVVMFSDFQCSVCAAKHPVLQKVLSEYGGQVRFVVRNFPLTAIHKDAYNAALAANAAAAQGKFFEYTELLYRNQTALDVASLKKYAVAAGLNPQKFELDFQSEKVAADVKKDVADGKELGISGTPSIYVNGVRVRFLNVDGFRDAIDRALKK
ncbi:MAG: thioredoxin domain-containing protein [Acidobacteria bacterium]|nr:thioredoxin domain-containing protein [Acidobacteriota bacterium]